MPAVHLVIDSEVPVARGLGSSSTCIAGGMAAANAMLGNPFTTDDLFQLCTAFEGHPDNAAPAFLGGLNPIGTILASFFIQHITIGGAYVDKTMYCAQVSDLISAIIIYLCGFVLFMKHAMTNSIAKREEKAALKAKASAGQDADNGKGGDQA